MRAGFFAVSLTGLTLASSTAFASGAVMCSGTTKDGKYVALDWGASHVVGNGRFGLYKLQIDRRLFAIAVKNSNGQKPDAYAVKMLTRYREDAASYARANKLDVKEAEVFEVGYWNAPSAILVHLTDAEAMSTELLLETSSAKDGYWGTLKLDRPFVPSPITIEVTCSAE